MPSQISTSSTNYMIRPNKYVPPSNIDYLIRPNEYVSLMRMGRYAFIGYLFMHYICMK
jgi:hypothetical protein